MYLRIKDFDKLFGTMNLLQNRLNRFSSDFDSPYGSDWTMEQGMPRTNLYDTGEQLEIRAEVPGLDKNRLTVNIQGNYLEISGSRDSDVPEGYKIQNAERESVSFSRSMTLPVDVDTAKASAVIKDGILYLKLPKAEAVKPKRITIA